MPANVSAKCLQGANYLNKLFQIKTKLNDVTLFNVTLQLIEIPKSNIIS